MAMVEIPDNLLAQAEELLTWQKCRDVQQFVVLCVKSGIAAIEADMDWELGPRRDAPGITASTTASNVIDLRRF